MIFLWMLILISKEFFQTTKDFLGVKISTIHMIYRFCSQVLWVFLTLNIINDLIAWKILETGYIILPIFGSQNIHIPKPPPQFILTHLIWADKPNWEQAYAEFSSSWNKDLSQIWVEFWAELMFIESS